MAIKVTFPKAWNPRKKKSSRPKPAKKRAAAKKKATAHRPKPRKKNPTLVEFALPAFNPRKRGTNMAKTKKRSMHAKNSRGKSTPQKKKSNPHYGHKPRRRGRNPHSGFLGSSISNIKTGLWALVGLVLARQLPQMFLGASNTGIMGYAANFGTGVIASMVAGRVAGPQAAEGMIIGGSLYTINRVIQEKFSPVGQVLSLSGLGDALALGEIVTDGRAYFPLPVAYDNSGNPIIPTQIRPSPPALPAAPAGGMSGMGYPSRFRSRFAA